MNAGQLCVNKSTETGKTIVLLAEGTREFRPRSTLLGSSGKPRQGLFGTCVISGYFVLLGSPQVLRHQQFGHQLERRGAIRPGAGGGVDTTMASLGRLCTS